jgi:hypothetical protein
MIGPHRQHRTLKRVGISSTAESDIFANLPAPPTLPTVTPNNEPSKPLTAFMEDLVEYLNERSCDAYIWLLTIGIFAFGYGILALIAIPFFRLLP